MKKNRRLSIIFFITTLCALCLSGCSIGLTQQPEPQLFPVGLPFERGLMAYARGEMALSEQQMHEAIKRNPYDKRAKELLSIIIQENGGDVDDETLKYHEITYNLNSPENYLMAVVGRSPQLRQAVFVIAEKRARLRRANFDIGPELSIMTRFYPEAIFVTLTQTLNKFLQRPAKLNKAESELLEALANYAVIKNEVVGVAVNNYFNYQSAKQQIIFLRAEIKAHEHYLQVLETLIKKGYVEFSVWTEAKTKRDKVKQLLIAAEGLSNTSIQSLANLAQVDVQYIKNLPGAALQLPKLEIPADLALNKSAVQGGEALVSAEQANKKISLLSLPKVNLFASYGKPYTSDRVTFVRGWATGLRIQLPLLIWPLQKAKMAEHDALIEQLETEVEILLAKARHRSIKVYEDYRLTTQTVRSTRKLVENHTRLLQIMNQQKKWAEENERTSQILSFIQYYHGRYLHDLAQNEQQKAAFRWLRSQGAMTEELHFLPGPSIDISECSLKSRYIQQRNKAAWVRDISSLANEEHYRFLADFAHMRGVDHLFLMINPASIDKHRKAYAHFLKIAHELNLSVHAYISEFTTLRQSGQANSLIDSIVDFNRNNDRQMRFNGIRIKLPNLFTKDKGSPAVQLAGIREALQYISNNYSQENLSIGIDVDITSPTLSDIKLNSMLLLLPLIDDIAVVVHPKTANERLKRIQNVFQKSAKKPVHYWLGLDLHHLPNLPNQHAISPDERIDQQIKQLCRSSFQDQRFIGIALHTLKSYRHLLLNEQYTEK